MKSKDMTPRKRREMLAKQILRFSMCGTIRSSEPFFRYAHKLPEEMKQLKSDDIKDDMTFIWTS